MKKNNPDTPILLREAQGVLPKIYARYGPYSSFYIPPPRPPSPCSFGFFFFWFPVEEITSN